SEINKDIQKLTSEVAKVLSSPQEETPKSLLLSLLQRAQTTLLHTLQGQTVIQRVQEIQKTI
ncbi:hypothetical protein TI39_contig3095g00001, partial [Zymoseptoria brevis]